MKVTDVPCENCQKRSADCRIKCGAYKVYRYAKLKSYEQRLKRKQANDDFRANLIKNVERKRKRNGYSKFNQKRGKVKI